MISRQFQLNVRENPKIDALDSVTIAINTLMTVCSSALGNIGLAIFFFLQRPVFHNMDFNLKYRQFSGNRERNFILADIKCVHKFQNPCQ